MEHQTESRRGRGEGEVGHMVVDVRCLVWRLLGGQLLSFLEVLYFLVAVFLFVVLLSQHVGFVRQSGCDAAIREAVDNMSLEDVHIVEVKVRGSLFKLQSRWTEKGNAARQERVEGPESSGLRFSKERGLLLLPRHIAEKHSIPFKEVILDLEDKCFGSHFSKKVIEHVVGYEVLLLNTFQRLINDDKVSGYVYSCSSRKLYKMEPEEELSRWMMFRSKFAAVLTSLFVMYTTSGLVTFALRHVQVRILKLSMDLRAYMLSQMSRSVVDVIVRYSVDAIVFVPIVTGILFFLREFFEDLLLTFMVVFIAWLRELAVLLNARHWMSGKYLPRLLSTYFLGFHLYFFCFPLGFSWLALFTCVLFMQVGAQFVPLQSLLCLAKQNRPIASV